MMGYADFIVGAALCRNRSRTNKHPQNSPFGSKLAPTDVHSHFAVGGALCPDHFTSLESRNKPAPTNQGFSLQKRFGSQYGFSLIEVLLSLGILSVAMLIIFAILTPFIAQTGEVIESSTVSRITDRISAEIEQLSFDELVAVLNQETGLFASRMGDQLVLSNDPELDTRLPEEDRYFAITLSRNQDISPTSRDTAAGFLAFQIKIDRLLHAPDGALIQSPLDQTQAVFNTAVLRTDS